MLCISDKDQLQSSQCNGLVGLLCPNAIVFHVVGGQRQFISQSKIDQRFFAFAHLERVSLFYQNPAFLLHLVI